MSGGPCQHFNLTPAVHEAYLRAVDDARRAKAAGDREAAFADLQAAEARMRRCTLDAVPAHDDHVAPDGTRWSTADPPDPEPLVLRPPPPDSIDVVKSGRWTWTATIVMNGMDVAGYHVGLTEDTARRRAERRYRRLRAADDRRAATRRTYHPTKD